MSKTLPLAFVLFALSGVACSSADPITNKFDCKDVCQQYADCFNHDYDVDACNDRCQSDASNSDAKQQKLDDCHDCIGSNDSCVKDFANCSTSCATFITP